MLLQTHIKVKELSNIPSWTWRADYFIRYANRLQWKVEQWSCCHIQASVLKMELTEIPSCFLPIFVVSRPVGRGVWRVGFPTGFWGSTFLLTDDLKQGELTMLCWFVVPSCGTHKETEGSLRDFLTADIYQNRVNLKLKILDIGNLTPWWESSISVLYWLAWIIWQTLILKKSIVCLPIERRSRYVTLSW